MKRPVRVVTLCAPVAAVVEVCVVETQPPEPGQVGGLAESRRVPEVCPSVRTVTSCTVAQRKTWATSTRTEVVWPAPVPTTRVPPISTRSPSRRSKRGSSTSSPPIRPAMESVRQS